MPRTLNISAARRDLPTLFDRVTLQEGERVVIRRRDEAHEAVLVSRAYLDRLERAPRSSDVETPFSIMGSGAAADDVTDVVAAIRAEDAAESSRRRGQFAAAHRPARSR